jgi:polyhydroxyalkanoate synthesis regulator phasin
MEDLFKKFLYTGVGIVSSTAEKVQKTVNELVEKGKLTEEEGKKMLDEFVSDAESKKNEFEGKVKDLVDKALGKLDLSTREEVEHLNARIADLEEKLAKTKK